MRIMNEDSRYQMRTPKITRAYLQAGPDEDIAGGRTTNLGGTATSFENGRRVPVEPWPRIQKGVTPMRSFVIEPMQYAASVLAGERRYRAPTGPRA